MDEVAEDRLERRRLPVRTIERHVTDKFGIILFILAIVILWKGPSLHVRKTSDGKNSTAIVNDTSHLVWNESDSKINSVDGTTTKNTSKNGTYTWDKMARDFYFLDGNYSESGTIVIWTNVFICACIIIYSMSSLRADKRYRDRLLGSTVLLFVSNLGTRLILSFSYEKLKIPKQRLVFWWISDIIFAAIAFAKMPPRRVTRDEEDDDDTNVELGDSLGFSILFFITSCIPLKILFGKHSHEIDGNNHITIPVICYVWLIMYYLLLMANACDISLSVQRGTDRCRDFFEGLGIVIKYHFGTVCYHATLILPIIHATFVMNKKEFRTNSKISARRRFYLTHWKFPSLSPTLTAARGLNHSESIRELFRMFSSDSENLKDLQIYNHIWRCSLPLLLAINNLMLMSVWAHGATIDPRFSIATWVVYPISFTIAYIFINFFDVASDAIWFLRNDNVQNL